MVGTVLIVDDDPVTCELLRRLLEKEGFDTEVAANGSEAMTYLGYNPPPCLILLDMMMPLMDGWHFLSNFRMTPAWSAIPVIIMTGMGVASPEWAASLGASGLLKKPFDADELLGPIRELA